MAYRIVQAHVTADKKEKMETIRDRKEVIDSWRISDSGTRGSAIYSFLVRTQDTQTLSDKLQPIVGKKDAGKLLILPVEAALPIAREEQVTAPSKHNLFKGVSREELYDDIVRGTETGRTFFLLVLFSTIVAAIGLLEDNVAVIVGAMVIAPMLGPNMALAFATVLGDKALFFKAAKCNLLGFSLCLALSILIGMIWPDAIGSHELQLRTDVTFSAVILALASGAAGVLSLTSGVSGVLVGVMVAVALLPPAVTMGILLGAGEYTPAYGAALLLAVNIVCVNLAAKLTFLFKGVAPRTWYQKQKAKYNIRLALWFWVISLTILILLIYMGQS